ncbi:hypothetical protein [Bacillus sp. JCM 19041]|uniref:hypothetical protein n=1 Tax=Bacillus sp. JCM 19041 TaxID=1460637 RepID=UPI000B325F9C
MKKVYSLYVFDAKSAGLLFYVPLLIWSIVAAVILFFHVDTAAFFMLIQFLYIPFFGWWMTYRYSELLESGANDTLSPLYRSHLVLDATRLFMGMALLLGCLFLFQQVASGMDQPVLLMMYAYVLALNVFIGTMMLMLLLKSVELALGIVAIYTVVEYATDGQMMPWLISITLLIQVFMSLFQLVYL